MKCLLAVLLVLGSVATAPAQYTMECTPTANGFVPGITYEMVGNTWVPVAWGSRGCAPNRNPGTVRRPPQQPPRFQPPPAVRPPNPRTTLPPPIQKPTPIEPSQNPKPACPPSDIDERLKAIEKALAKLGNQPPQPGCGVDLSGMEAAIAKLQEGLTALGDKLDNASDTQGKVADAIIAMAEAQLGTNTKLDAAIALLKKGQSGTLKLIVQSTPNLPASYVDTSTIWAVQRRTGISHIVLVMNSNDPEWARLKPEYEKAKHKFPAIQLVDVQSDTMKISPTPQLVLYYVKEGRKPEIVSGDRAVAAKLRELYVN